VFREGVNRSVGDCVIKMMGVVHVRSHRWPSTTESILLRIVHVLFKGTALGVGHGRDASIV
jgi:hypothetical protein